MNLFYIFSYYQRSNVKHQRIHTIHLHSSGKSPRGTGTPGSYESPRQAGQITSLFGEKAFSLYSLASFPCFLNFFIIKLYLDYVK